MKSHLVIFLIILVTFVIVSCDSNESPTPVQSTTTSTSMQPLGGATSGVHTVEIPTLVQSTTTPTSVQPLGGVTSGAYTLYIREVTNDPQGFQTTCVYFNEAFVEKGCNFTQPAQPGWQKLYIELVFENNFTQPLDFFPPMFGVLIDSEGYQRELMIYNSDLGSIGLNSGDIRWVMWPGVRVHMEAIAEIPATFTGKSIIIQDSARTPVWTIDLANAIPSLSVPFDTPPPETLNDSSPMVFGIAQVFNLTLDSFVIDTLESWSQVTANGSIENNGGFNLDPTFLVNSSIMSGVDSYGNYISGYYEGTALAMELSEGAWPLAPGQRGSAQFVLADIGLQVAQYEWLWLGFHMNDGNRISVLIEE